MNRTYIEAARGNNYIVSWSFDTAVPAHLMTSILRFARCKADMSVIFVLGHGSCFMHVFSFDDILQRDPTNHILSVMQKYNVTGIMVSTKEEAIALEEEIIKDYTWSLLAK